MTFWVFFFLHVSVYTLPVVLRCMFVSQQLQVDGLRSSLHTPVLKRQHERNSDTTWKTLQPTQSLVPSGNKVHLLKYCTYLLYRFEVLAFTFCFYVNTIQREILRFLLHLFQEI